MDNYDNIADRLDLFGFYDEGFSIEESEIALVVSRNIIESYETNRQDPFVLF